MRNILILFESNNIDMASLKKYSHIVNCSNKDLSVLNSSKSHVIEYSNMLSFSNSAMELVNDGWIKKNDTLKERYRNLIIFKSIKVPLARLITILEDLLITEADRVDISDSVIHPSFFLFEAEGERNGQFFYKSFYFLPFLVEHLYLRENKVEYRVIKRHRYLFVHVVHVLRNILVLTFKFFSQFVYSALSKDKVEPLRNDENVIVLRGKAHINYYESIKEHFDNFRVIVCESSFGPRRLQKKIINPGFVYGEGNIPILKLCALYIRALFSLMRYAVRPNSNPFILDFTVLDFVYDIHALNIRYSIGTNVDVIITLEMHNGYPFYIKKRIPNAKIIQLQNSSIRNINMPSFVIGDSFIFTDSGNYSFYKNIGFKSVNLFTPADLYSADLSHLEKFPKNGASVTFFCQPYNKKDELAIIDRLLYLMEMHSFDLSIRLHPRDNESDMPRHLLKYLDYNILSETIRATDVGVTRNSSIGLEFWRSGKLPVFISLHNESFGLPYIPDDYFGLYSTLDFDFIEDIDQIIKSYLYNRPFIVERGGQNITKLLVDVN